jgi:Na+/H+-translocating membrane pyrophosphatase
MGRELLDGIQSGVQEMVQERIDDEVSQIQIMDITRAAALLDANVEEETIEGFCANIGICGQARLIGLSVRVRRNERYNKKSGLRSGFFIAWKGCAFIMKKY